jgi:alpha-ketoglutarate-dependent taurine dioxygenase
MKGDHMKVLGQATIRLSLREGGMVSVTVWHGDYARENKPENYRLVESFTCPKENFENIGISLPKESEF